ncbi:LEA type 2 family protein [Arenimonas fontis]|uniref:LEA type 2 family protein n=1 Tax=Arenimonas fontis TaxID=2608255 RepID=A0A5B2Z7F8_9GAMM|nr:LEA type 2 family protein [Arenimonas fontis]KAA2283899.1 LEA type 2 family protein [Arenimonas fontis]
MCRFRLLLPLLSALLLVACAGGPPKRIFPPQVSLHELKVEADGQWTAQLRIRNFSTVPMHFNRLSATLSIGAEVAGRIEVDPGLGVGPGSSELVSHRFSPSPAARAVLDQALAQRRGLRYRLEGRITSKDPGTDDPFDYQSALDPVPGLSGVLR